MTDPNIQASMDATDDAATFADDDALAFDEGAEGEHAAHELGECDPDDCPHDHE